MSLKDLLFVKALGGGGGGGSSDVSIANLTITWDAYAMNFAHVDGALCLESDEIQEGSPAATFIEYYPPYVEELTTKTLKVALYKGKALISFEPGNGDTFDVVTTGGISFSEDLNYWVLTGDATVTITTKSSSGK